MYYVYVLKKNGEWYIGYTSDIDRRIGEHKKASQNCKLMYYEAYSNEQAARTRERRLKLYGSAWRGFRSRIEA